MKKKFKVCFWVLLSITILFTMCTVNLQADTKTITKDSEGTHDEYYYYFWNEGGSVAMTLGEGGNFGVKWSECSNFICGKGWEIGSPSRIVNFLGGFNGGNNGYLALYGWSKNRAIEYYVIEDYGLWEPPGANPKGTFESDGGTYKIYTMDRYQHGIVGPEKIEQYYSVRTTRRSSGKITFSNHVEAWKNIGFPISITWGCQIMEIEGYQSTGSANISVSGYISDITPTETPIITLIVTPTPTETSKTTLIVTPTPAKTNRITSDKTGIHNGYYYNFWNQGGGSVVASLGDGGNFSLEWSECTNCTCGKGWSTGSPNRIVSFSGSYDGGDNGYLALYGLNSINSLGGVEYYVIENYGLLVPPGGDQLGTLESDGGTYKIYKQKVATQTGTYDQFFSVRTSKRSSGTITFSNHVNAWKRLGFPESVTWKCQIMEAEGYYSSGSANITVSGYIPDITPTNRITYDQTGTDHGYYYNFWNQAGGGGSVAMTLGEGGNFSVDWSDCSNFTCGKGWEKGSPNRIVSFSGSFNDVDNGYLALYGWTQNPLIEYYVIENQGQWVPPGSNPLGTLESDGGTYNIYKMKRNTVDFNGLSSYDQYFSVRTSRRSSGRITFSNHVEAWKSIGFPLNATWDYQIMETEGYQSSGSANITVSGYIPDITPTATPTATPTIINIGEKKYGDVNEDGIVDSADYTVLRQYLLGKITSVASSDNADVNGDKTIDSGDYTLLRKYLLEVIKSFPAESITNQS